MSVERSVLQHVAAIPPYVPGRPISSVARDLGFEHSAIIKLASNENPAGMSPAARRSITALVDDPSRYPDSDCFELKAELSARLNIAPERLIIGAGSSELIQLAARAVLGSQHTAVLSEYAFIAYEAAVRSVGARPVIVPARGWAHNLARMLVALDASARLVFIASPNNPTGTVIDPAELSEFIGAVPEHVLIVLDETYRDYVAPEQRPDTAWLSDRHKNLLVLRTFSKVYGLAGLRIGYGIADPAIIGVLKRLQIPFSVSVLAQAAAIAALGDTQFVESSVALNASERAKLCRALTERGCKYVPPRGNFVLLYVGDGESVFRRLLSMGIVVRPMASYGLAEWIRVSIGLPAENAKFLRSLLSVLPAYADAGASK